GNGEIEGIFVAIVVGKGQCTVESASQGCIRQFDHEGGGGAWGQRGAAETRYQAIGRWQADGCGQGQVGAANILDGEGPLRGVTGHDAAAEIDRGTAVGQEG